MFRFGITMMWGAMSALLVFAASDKIVPSFLAGAVLAVVLGLSLYVADTVAAPIRRKHKEKPLLARAGSWFVLYEVVPAAILYAISLSGLFFLPAGLLTAFAMCLPISLIVLKDYVDLSWLSY